jgi:hypothetical protein
VLERLQRAGHDVSESEHGPAVADPSGNVLVLAV